MASPYHNEPASLLLSFYCNCFGLLLLMQGLTIASDAPTFKSVPTTVKTSEHDTVLLPCYVDNLGANGIKWWKDDMLIWDTNNNSLIGPANVRMFASNNTLEVSDVSASDTGDYVCQVVRPAPWGPLNQIHAIEVQFPPIVAPIPESSELEVALDEDVVMGCTATGVPSPIITWSFEGKPIQLLTNRPTLTFKVTDRKMAGEYQCIANNGVGEPATASILLKVTYPPVVLTEKLWIHTAPGLRADISCIVNANPDGKVEWSKDGHVIDGSTRIVPMRMHDKHLLIIRNVRATDFGFYTCKASNGIGQGQQTIQLSGISNTAVFKKSSKLNKHNVTLIWEVDSYSVIVEYSLLFRLHQLYSQPSEWTKLVIPADPDSLGPLHTQTYTLTGLKSASIYEASVLSRNRFGWSRPSDVYRFSTPRTDDEKDEDDIENNQEDGIEDKSILAVDEEIDRNTIETVISVDFGNNYHTGSMTSSSTRAKLQFIFLSISGAFVLATNFLSCT